MTNVTVAGDGDSELAAPVDDLSGPDGDSAATPNEGSEGPARRTKTVSLSGPMLLVGGILVIVIAQLVMTWLVLSATTQLRDQYTAANGLQRCLIRAQLNLNQTTDPSGTAYKAAVNNCLK